MILYALGEAFRSGTHKAMIMAYLDKHNIKQSKTKVYGLTRAYSLIGSMVASIVSIGLVLWLPELKYLFLFVLIPYALDLLLILSCQNYLNDKKMLSFLINLLLSITLMVFYIRLKRRNEKSNFHISGLSSNF